jgi:7-cyano-7-deazaguanine synthase
MTSPNNNIASCALVLFSGGQDSTVCLAWALANFDHVETVGFDYGQRHAIELEVRLPIREKLVQDFPQWKDRLGADHILNMETLGAITQTAMTEDVEIKLEQSGLPNTFVPGRNLLFFTYAAALGYRRDIFNLVGGMCETDYSGYPDCRDKTLKSLGQTLSLGTDAPYEIITPLMWLDKSQTWAMAHDLGGVALVDLIIENTHSCYKGERGKRHEWGYGCDECPACDLRNKGYRKWRSA